MRENSTMDKARSTRDFDRIVKSRISVISNIEKLMYYLDISNIKIRKVEEETNKIFNEYLVNDANWTETENIKNKNYILRRKKLINDTIGN